MLERFLRHPSRAVVLGFAGVIGVGTVLLALPLSKQGAGGVGLLTALFYSTSAVCVTGLGTVDLPTTFSTFGQVVILALVQVGGFGIMTFTSLIALVIARRLGLRTRLLASAESGVVQHGDLRRVLKGVVVFTVLCEAVLTLILSARLLSREGLGFGDALWQGGFTAVSAFNNAGFSLWSDSLVRFVGDWVVTLAVAAGIVVGGIGFPVVSDLVRNRFSRSGWSLHTKLTLSVTGLLLVLGTVAVLGFEYDNEQTLGPLGLPGKLLAAFFGSVTARTAGFNSIDYGHAEGETLFVTDMLMFVGGGSGGTAGGIKVATFAVVMLMVISEARGDRHVTVFRRRVAAHAQRQALVIAFLGVNAVVFATLALMATSDFPLYQSLFESISAFGTVGLSTGITGQLDAAGQSILIALMFVGRIGPHTLALALVLRERERLFAYPEERPFIG